ncbi:MAG: cysteine hydrolase [Pseudomonadota bacterium]
MATGANENRRLIEGRPAILVIDIQASTFIDDSEERSIPNMAGYKERMLECRSLIDKAREFELPVIFIQEVHHPSKVDFGRELDGSEDIHCLEGAPGTALAVEQMGVRPDDYIVPKRRYSSFFGTDLEILLKGLRVDTLILCGGLTDVCVHYTFVDGHQSDYFCRVVEECVGGSSEEAHEAALRAMEYLQTGARRSLNEVLEAIGGQS